jgi:hypothetical protein
MGGVVCFTSDFSSVVARSHTVNRLLAIGYWLLAIGYWLFAQRAVRHSAYCDCYPAEIAFLSHRD